MAVQQCQIMRGYLFSKTVILQTVSKLYGMSFQQEGYSTDSVKIIWVSFQQESYSTDSVKIIWVSFQQGGYSTDSVKIIWGVFSARGLFYRQCQNYMVVFSTRGVILHTGYSVKKLYEVSFQQGIILQTVSKLYGVS